MKIGVSMFSTQDTIRTDELAVEAELRGFESVWVPQHTHIPINRKSPWPMGGDLPPHYAHMMDPYVVLTAAAMATSQIRLGTSVAVVGQQDHFSLAKTIASLDVLSGGRLTVAVGYNWMEEEVADHGIPFRGRREIVHERVGALRALWTMNEAEFHGEHIDFGPCWAWPKPVQKPHPPLLLGVNGGPLGLEAVVKHFDGWLPVVSALSEDVLVLLERLRQLAAKRGRDPQTLSVTAADNEETITAEDLERYRTAGIERFIIALPPETRDQTCRLLDRNMKWIKYVGGDSEPVGSVTQPG